jgi:hypothetical protein
VSPRNAKGGLPYCLLTNLSIPRGAPTLRRHAGLAVGGEGALGVGVEKVGHGGSVAARDLDLVLISFPYVDRVPPRVPSSSDAIG